MKSICGIAMPYKTQNKSNRDFRSTAIYLTYRSNLQLVCHACSCLCKFAALYFCILMSNPFQHSIIAAPIPLVKDVPVLSRGMRHLVTAFLTKKGHARKANLLIGSQFLMATERSSTRLT